LDDVAGFLDEDFAVLETKGFGQADGLALAVFENFGGFHDGMMEGFAGWIIVYIDSIYY
jgi:hypothetical protein